MSEPSTVTAFFFVFCPTNWWERVGLDALEQDEEAFQKAMEETHPPMKATGKVESNYKSTCPFYRGYWLHWGIQSWTECEVNGHMTGAAWYQFCGKAPEACPIFNQHKGEMQT